MCLKKESEGFERLLKEGCKSCETELKGFREVVGQLGYSAPPADTAGFKGASSCPCKED